MRKLLALSDDLEGRELYTVVGGDDARDLVARLDKTLKRRRRLDGVVLQLETKHGTKTLAVSTRLTQPSSDLLPHSIACGTRLSDESHH